jgi:2-polyprenyl-6-methoxyphenol hydroxylase-like FAD-dependent oxidoreductase
MQKQHYDVVIVGGGAVGLSVACELRLAGASVLVLERRVNSEGWAETRAAVVHARTLETFALRGLLDRFLEAGTKTDWWHYGVLETRLNYNAFGDESKQNYVSLVPQYKTEQIFLERAQDLGVVVMLGMSVQSFEQSPTSVTVHATPTTPHDDGTAPESFTVVGKYLVGADGVRSTIRTKAGIDFPGRPGTKTLLTGEALVGVEMPNPFIMHTAKGLVICVKLKTPSGRTRLNVFTPNTGPTPVSEPVSLEEISQELERVTGTDFKLSSPCHLGRFSNEARCATTYRSGRVLLAGDAAHQHFPASGQGLNTGIQEGFNLAWKLGAVLNGYAPESLLDTYGEERLPIARGVIENTTAQSLLFFAESEPDWAIRGTLNRLLSVPEANRALAFEISGFSVAYPKPLDMVRPDGWEALPEAIEGKRALNVKLKLTSGEEKDLFDCFQGAKWVQLRFVGDGQGSTSSPAFGRWTEVVDVADIVEGKADMYRTGLSELLIRPDGYLSFGRH